MRDARSQPVRAGVEVAKKSVAALAWREGWGSDPDRVGSVATGRRVAKGTAPGHGQRTTPEAAGGGGHRKFHNLKAATWIGGGERQQGMVDCPREASPSAPAGPEPATVQRDMHIVRRDASAPREG